MIFSILSEIIPTLYPDQTSRITPSFEIMTNEGMPMVLNLRFRPYDSFSSFTVNLCRSYSTSFFNVFTIRL